MFLLISAIGYVLLLRGRSSKSPKKAFIGNVTSPLWYISIIALSLCTEFKVEGKKESIRYYLDAEEYELLNDFENNQEKIKNIITARNRQIMGVDDMPYIIGVSSAFRYLALSFPFYTQNALQSHGTVPGLTDSFPR